MAAGPGHNGWVNASASFEEPSRAQVDALAGAAVLEFGTSWCGWCRRAQPLIQSALAAHPLVRHIKVEDGPGRPLGRSFRVKLWPTLVFLRDGQEVDRVVRPADEAAVAAPLEQITAG
ncbi:thioredoxin family protein [Ramlibacter tataouinensis]|uniref:thioredoxin family protein n=1 Tax=Ramlibacter tataouinensis TaxID=94132 RepID=UPI00077753EB